MVSLLHAAGLAESRRTARKWSEPIAIVGVGARFPGGVKDALSFWDLVAGGHDAIGDVPADRWKTGAFYDPDPATPGRMFIRQGGFLESPLDGFDAGFFGLAPREAAALDPQQRVLLEVTWEAFEDAGIPMGSTASTDVGTFVGGFTFDAASLALTGSNQHLLGASTPTGVIMTMLSARLSYTFDWHGPCFTIDTACSSSLVAFHQACAAIDRGECELAVAGGVNMMFVPASTMAMAKGQFLSPDARCRSFDHRANGYVRSEGAGLVVLKPLSAALRDGDRIRAVVRGSAVNHDGRTPGAAVPSAEAQGMLIRQACEMSGVRPGSIGYYEAHGTGTPVGDPIEVAAIGGALDGSPHTHWIGSVKSNFGHTEAAAGIAGVIKASLCLERGLVPPNLHFEKPNPQIPFDRLPVKVPTALVPFPQYDGPRRAGINSFGAGGTNAHAILEQAPVIPVSEVDESELGEPRLLALSARSPEALRALAEDYATLLEQPDAPILTQVARAAARQRDHHPVRTFVVAANGKEAAERLRELDPAGRRTARPQVAFVYTGMGPQWWGMGRELLLEEPRFAEVVAECDAVLSRFDVAIGEELLRDEGESRLTTTLYAQVANFVVQAGLTALWRDWGIEPATIVGHSVGEVAAAHAAGVYSLEDALTVSYHRACLQSRLAGRGVMAAVGLPVDEVTPYLVDGVTVAAINSASATTLAGDRHAMDVVAERLESAGESFTALRVDVAYHSHHMDEIREPLLAALRDIRPRRAAVTLLSTVTGGQVDGSEFDAGYWWRNVRQVVRFADAFRHLLGHSPGAVLEIGPHPVLATAIDEASSERGAEVVRLASLRRDRPQRRQLLETLGSLYATGVDPDWERVHPGPREHLDLPLYPWQRESHWLESTASRRNRLGVGGLSLSGQIVAAATPTRDVELSPVEFPYLVDHKIGDELIFPGAGYLETALAMFPDDEPCFFEDIVFHRPLVIAPSSVTTLRTGYDPVRRHLTLHGFTKPDEPDWTLHAELRRTYLAAPQRPAPRTESLPDLTRSLPMVGREELYERLGVGELDYGPCFRAVDRLWVRNETGEVFAEIDLGTVDREGHRLHPVHLDAALQSVFAGGLLLGGEAADGTYVPAGIAEFRFFRSPGERLWVHGRDRHSDVPGRYECDITLVTDGGEIVAELIGLRAQRLAEDSTVVTALSQSLYYEHAWHPEPLEPTGDAGGSWILVGSSPRTIGLEKRIVAANGTVVRVDPADEDWLVRLRAALARDSSPVRVVHLAGAPAGAIDVPACSPAADPLTLTQALPEEGVRLFLVTSGTQSVSSADAVTDPFAAATWGLGRVVNAERPELGCRLIDLDPGTGWSDGLLLDGLLAELTHDGQDEVALRDGTRYVRRIEPAGDLSPLHQVRTRTDVTPVSLGVVRTSADNLRFAATTRRAPGPDQVEVEVVCTGVNFKDVLKVTGLLTGQVMEGTHSRGALGLECSGTVVRTGRNVPDLRPGDEVIVHSRALFASHVTVDAVRVVKKPAALSFAQAASLLPVVTAHQSLVRLAGVRAGERVLVHSAAGGVGLAAVRIAAALGAEVYATAGSKARREYLREAGVAHVADSRSTTFAGEVLEWTGGEGVDVILDSLPADMIHHSLGVLRTFGRFVELGKLDGGADPAVRSAVTRKAMTFHAFDYDQMMALDPVRVRECLRETVALFEEGVISPLPVTEIPADEVDKAFMAMGSPDHLGKIVVRIAGEPVTVPATSLPETPIRDDAGYVVTGGLGGLGRTVARLLADRGARHLVLVGRRGVTTPEAEHLVAELTARGVEVQVEKADVADLDQVEALLSRVRERLPVIAGIVHAAADFDDVVLSDTNATRLLEATRPKADGAWNLHVATEPDSLDFFVLFSSVGAQLGSAALGAYATANEFLDALARHRTARGLPATSIGWGLIEEVGVAVSGKGEVGTFLRRNGHLGISPARFAAELDTLLRTRPVEATVADMDWPRWARSNPQLASLPRVSSIVATGGDDGGPSGGPRLQNLGPEERATVLPALLAPLLQQSTGLTEGQLDDDQPVDVDSLTAVGLRVLVQKELGVSIPAVKLQRDLTMSGLVGLLVAELDRAPAETFEPARDLTVHEFASGDGLTVYGHLSSPPGPGPHPAVVVCTSGRGGALNADGVHVQVGEHEPLRAAGLAVFTVDHRGAPGHGADFDALAEMGGREVDDVLAAASYLAGLPGIDGARVSVLGTSRGGYTALSALGREPSRWHRAVLLMGLYDPAHLVAAERAEPGSFLPARPGFGPDELVAYFTAPHRRPLASIGDVSAPVLVVHGEDDEIIPVEQAQALVSHAQASDLPARLVTVAGLGHDSGYVEDDWDTLWPEVADFLTSSEPAT
ncbi:SDR family NAD(P)-dependent oxidoreductase [Amycolatopsis sp. NPDC051061]|uniref:SDR family NAD(P)-dependent oxidoreductase n=1 Tax=Amycolatopsis sp. NPDC051061 TaxID=3155042 RepID=UPI00342808CF